ncbi:MAG: hypothetical protein A2Y62_03460 [Candidatus Fischerbacteria bacterium RBG_13_37_8]|uniref:Peptidase C-terminal archaeal/bacterial domain-containing protein n=1 Tax=Candidatus Fischerbacteria bacterium RBG_13_37_8 TaxID=1817863 RepID=A0A1F5VK88_9BACT|nr:MAG: hypothetical protein A2Y62_03460 [Candidatus Fischerbacteria bacterium RBG_13_37_8]
MRLAVISYIKKCCNVTVCLMVLALFIASAVVAEATEEGIPCDAEPTNMNITYGYLVTCSLDDGDIDTFRFYGQAGETIWLHMHSQGSYPCIKLFKPDSTTVQHCSGTWNAYIESYLDQTGTYTITAQQHIFGGGFNYEISLQRVSPPSDGASLIQYGQTITDEINPESDADLFYFGGTIGYVITAQATSLSSPGCPCVALYRPDGTQVGTTNCACATAGVYATLDQNGTYSVLVTENGVNSTMGYQVFLDCSGGGCTSGYGFANVLGFDKGNSMDLLSNNAAIIAGYTSSFGAGMKDVAFLQVDAIGNIVSRRTYGGTNDDVANSIVKTADGGSVIAGYTNSYGAGNTDALILKLNSVGNIIWRRTYGGTNADIINSIIQTSDGGYIAAGETSSYSAGSADMLLIKLNSSGNILWRRTYGGVYSETATSIVQTSDGGYLVAGYTDSFGSGTIDALIMKLNASGNILWRRTYGGPNEDKAYSVLSTSDGAYIIAGTTKSFGAGNNDALVMKLDSSGNIQWRRTFGTAGDDGAYSITQTADGGYLIGGYAASFGSGPAEGLMIKLSSSGVAQRINSFGGAAADYILTTKETSSGDWVATGQTASFSSPLLALKVDSTGNIPACSYFTTPALTITAPSISATAPALSGSAPALSGSAPAFTITAPSIANTKICP